MSTNLTKKHDCMLTTVDNPYDPFNQFEQWLQFDNEKGYNTSGRVMRLAKITDDMSDEESDAEVERAMDKLIEIDFFNIFQKVFKPATETSIIED